MHALVAIPLRICNIYLKAGTQNVFGVIESGGFQDCSDGYRYVRHDMDGRPIELAELLDRLSREFGRRDIEEEFGVGGFHGAPLRVDCCQPGFVGALAITMLS